MTSDDDDKPPPLRVVSDNPNAREDRAALWAKQVARQKLSEFAASLFRATAGSDTEAWHLLDRLGTLLDSLAELNRTSGRSLSVADVKEALRMPSVDLDGSSDDYESRRWLRNRGHELIVQGALRLAAHNVLDERPHFGGKHSKDVIADGIRLLEEANAPIRRPRPVYPNPPPQMVSTSATPAKVTAAAPLPPRKASNKRGARSHKRDEFSQADLMELRKAIKARDDKRIKELTSKIGKRTPEN